MPPRNRVQPALVHSPAIGRPAASLASGPEREQVARHHVAGQQRHETDDDQRDDHRDADDGLDLGGAQDALVLDREHDQEQAGAQDRGGVDAKRQAFLEEAQVGERDAPGQDRRVGGEERGEDVAGGDPAADGEHRRPGDPVAPDRERRDDPAVAHPGGRAIDRGAAGLARETGPRSRRRCGPGRSPSAPRRSRPPRTGCRSWRRCRRSRTAPGAARRWRPRTRRAR